MLAFIFIVTPLIVLFITHRRICSKACSIKKKLIIPTIFFIASFILVLYVNNEICVHSNILRSYTSSNDVNGVIRKVSDNKGYEVIKNGDFIASIVYGKKSFSAGNLAELLLLFNIPTFLTVLFIFTGKISSKTKEL